MPPFPSLDEFAEAVTGRPTSLFETAFEAIRPELEQTITGKNILFTGGAGFIATQTLKVLLDFEPKSVVIVDSSENGLAEVVRNVRSSGQVSAATRIEPRLVDITSPLVDRLWPDLDRVDAAFEFAAAKHVRSERDPVSLLRMIHVNLNGTFAFTRALVDANPEARVFVVSTDKAADPSSLMGASKRLMELAVLGNYPWATSTRFANVAFSSGSLPESWLIRLRQQQPLAVPRDTWRYFVTPREAGQLCAIASVGGPGSITVPDEGEIGAVELESALARVLELVHLAPLEVTAEEALSGVKLGPRHVPVVKSLRDTAGEKRTEKFVGHGEDRTPWLTHVDRVLTSLDPAPADRLRARVERLVMSPEPPLGVADIAAEVMDALPDFAHVSSSQRLDDRL